MNENSTAAAPQRRIGDMPLPGYSLEWGEDGTPLQAPETVYQYRPNDPRYRMWSDIETRELLEYVKSEPARFELRTLFTEPVGDLARAPAAAIADALRRKDRIEAACEKAISGMREVARETAARP